MINIKHQLAKLAQFPEMNPSPVCQINRAGTVLFANQAALKFLGVTSAVGERWFDICPGMTNAVWDRILNDSSFAQFDSVTGEEIMQFTFVHSVESDSIVAFETDLSQ